MQAYRLLIVKSLLASEYQSVLEATKVACMSSSTCGKVAMWASSLEMRRVGQILHFWSSQNLETLFFKTYVAGLQIIYYATDHDYIFSIFSAILENITWPNALKKQGFLLSVGRQGVPSLWFCECKCLYIWMCIMHDAPMSKLIKVYASVFTN